jgi:hypothetical protein
VLLAAQSSVAGRAAEPPPVPADEVLSRVDRLEELLLKLTPELKGLDTSVLNLTLPDTHSHRLFEQMVTVTDIAPAALPPLEATADLVAVHDWPVDGTPRSAAPEALRLWRPFLDGVDYFTYAHFKLYRGRFLDPAETRYAGDLRFDANARLSSGPQASVEAKMMVTFVKYAEGPGEPVWRIQSWQTKSFTLTQTARPLFADSPRSPPRSWPWPRCQSTPPSAASWSRPGARRTSPPTSCSPG